MAEATLAHVNQLLETSILQPLADAAIQIENNEASPRESFQSMVEETSSTLGV